MNTDNDDQVIIINAEFAGSGTTVAVAKKLGRRSIGIEISPNYADQAQARVGSVKPGDPLAGPEDPLRSAPPSRKGRHLAAPDKDGSASTSTL